MNASSAASGPSGGHGRRITRPESPVGSYPLDSASTMIIYEVNLTVDRDVADDYADWLAEHVREMLTLPGFESAEWLVDTHYDADEGADPRWSIWYRLGSRDDFVRYEQTHAERMRAEGLERFGTKFKATRRILEEREAFGG